jgi:hypothetical protein
MTMTADVPGQVPWWKEPTKDQWVAWVAAWLGWTLDAFDFTIFLLIMVPIAETFNVPLIEVTAVFTITLWLRLVGAVGSGWLADRIGRKAPLMISILWYSVCNLFAGIAPSFALLFLFRALLGIGMGAEWPAGAALAMEVQSEDWKKDSLTFSLLLRALQRHGKDDDELRLVDHYFRREAVGFGPLAGTQGTVHAEFSGTFDRLRRGKIGELFGTTTNVTPDDILNGAVLVVNIPTDTWREAGKLAQTIWVQSLLRACNRRPYQAPAKRPVVLWQDEFQEYTADSDASFQSGARSKGLIAIRLTQNLGGCYAAYGGPAGQHKVDQLLGVHSTKIWHRNDDPTTNDWASKIIGSDRVTRTSVSESGGTSLSEHDDPLCPPSKFLGLANGGPEHRWTVEAIVAQSGRLFGKDRCFVGEFKQR